HSAPSPSPPLNRERVAVAHHHDTPSTIMPAAHSIRAALRRHRTCTPGAMLGLFHAGNAGSEVGRAIIVVVIRAAPTMAPITAFPGTEPGRDLFGSECRTSDRV